jgi:ankyrin repeat protein
MARTFADLAARYATHPEMAGVTIDGPDVIGTGRDGLLHLAARMGQAEDARDLVRLGATIDLPGDRGFTALHYAAAAGHGGVVDVLLELGANLDAKNDWEQTALEVAMLAGHGALMERL